MFTDEDLEPVEFPSTWKKVRSLAEAETQTKDLQTQEQAVQSVKRKQKVGTVPSNHAITIITVHIL